jgi:hypothetical protein
MIKIIQNTHIKGVGPLRPGQVVSISDHIDQMLVDIQAAKFVYTPAGLDESAPKKKSKKQ